MNLLPGPKLYFKKQKPVPKSILQMLREQRTILWDGAMPTTLT